MKEIFGGTIAVVLLGIYVHLIRVACMIVHCVDRVGCEELKIDKFNDVMGQSMSLIGGLVSALVIAELAVTKPGDAPAAHILSDNSSLRAQTILKYVTATYVLVWICAGLAAYLVGMYHPSTLPALTNVGQSWLGLAVAAAYAYFGLNTTKS